MIINYFLEIDNTIFLFGDLIKNYTKTEKTYSQNKGCIHGNIVFKDDSILSFMELKDAEKTTKNKYSYHYMTSSNEFVFRYDNAEYHREIQTFPHHKHLPDKIVEANEPQLIDVLIEVFTKIKMNL